jgi:hypothetical protein
MKIPHLPRKKITYTAMLTDEGVKTLSLFPDKYERASLLIHQKVIAEMIEKLKSQARAQGAFIPPLFYTVEVDWQMFFGRTQIIVTPRKKD